MENFTVALWALVSVLIVSLVSLVGIALLSLQEKIIKKLLLYLVSFATGALFTNVFGHLLPEIVEESHDLSRSFLLIFIGILFSFVIEKFIHWRHCHTLACHHQVHPVGKMMLIGDGAHNMMDGILIATAYLASIPLGIATTVAVIFHEIPQEIGDFSVLLHSGYSRRKALALNFVSALTAVLGTMVVLLLHESVHGIEQVLLPLTAGNFLYIAGSDLIPELHKETRLGRALLQLLCIIAGAGLLYALAPAHIF